MEATVGLSEPTSEEMNTVVTLIAETQFNKAVIMSKHLAVRFPHHGFGWKALGTIFHQLGRSTDALYSMQKAATLYWIDAETHNNLGVALRNLGHLEEAAASYRRALEIQPYHAAAHNNLGNILHDLGRLNEAEAAFRRALEIRLDFTEAYGNLGSTLVELGQLNEAEKICRRVLHINPDYAEAHFNLANVLSYWGQLDKAAASYRQCLAIKSDYAEAHFNLGNTLHELTRLEEAEASFRAALKHKDVFVEALSSLGDTLRDLGRLDQAELSYRHALSIDPAYPTACVALAMLTLLVAPRTIAESATVPARFLQELENCFEWITKFRAQKEEIQSVACRYHPFYLAYRPGNHLELLCRYGELATDRSRNKPLFQRRLSQRKLRIVVVSRRFCRHSVWYINLRGLLVHLDRQKFEVILYHVGHGEDKETELARSLADVWRDCQTVTSFNGWLDAMALDQPDVILYPEIGMAPTTLRLANCRLAPLQAACWGHPISTGLPTIDLYFSGDLLEPPDADKHYRERLIRLPGTGCCTTQIEVIPAELDELEALLASRSGPRFLIAQMPFKFDPSDDHLYASIAAAVGNCTFILLRPTNFSWATEIVLTRISQEFCKLGLVPERHLMAIPWLSLNKFYSLLDLSDIYLDCPAFSGYTTAWQAIHRGLPVVTLEGRYMRQRLAAGLLRKVGLPETIATCDREYVTIATLLAEECSNRDRRNARRQEIKSRAPEMDNDISVVRAFEKTLIETLASE